MKNFLKFLDQIAQKNPFTWVLGLSRTCLAIGTLSVLLFNESEVLFPKYTFNIADKSGFFNQINFFFFFHYDALLWARLIACTILLFVMIGFFPRYTCLFHWWISWSFLSASSVIDGGDQVTAVITFFLMPICFLDNRKNSFALYYSKNVYKNFVAWSFLAMIQIQVAIIYLQAGIEKLYKTEEWLNGTAIYYWFNHNIFGMPVWMQDFVNKYFLSNALYISLITWGVMIWELFLFSLLLTSAKMKRRFLIPALFFHLIIWFVHGLFSFFMAMSGVLILYLLPLQEEKPKFLKWISLH